MKRYLVLAALAIFLLGCTETKKQGNLPEERFTGVAIPVQLNLGVSEIYLTDFILDPMIIDSVYVLDKKIKLPEDKIRIFYRSKQDDNPLMDMKLWIEGTPYSVLLKKSRKVGYDFVFDPEGKEYGMVQLAGDFNGWTESRTNLQLKDGKWEVSLYLNPGKYQYLLVLDGERMLDPANPDSIDNNMGGFNSVMQVGNVDKSLIPFLYTEEYEGDDLEIGVMNEVTEYFVYWQNFRLGDEYVEKDADGLEIDIPKEAGTMQRSYIRVYAYNSQGVSNDILVPLQYGHVIDDPDTLNREDKYSMILYNVFVDRFFDGDTLNDEPLNRPDVLPKADYMGGDITGITKKIEEGYFDTLGVNTLWISPVVLNPKGAFGEWKNPPTKFSAYHGYWPISFTQIDPRYGTAGEFTAMVEAAHSHGFNVLLDFVAHHVHKEHPYYIAHPDQVTNLYLPDGSLNTERWDEYRLTTWFDVFLPTLDLQNPAVTEMLTDSAVWWLQTYDLDGFRHDATKHVPEYFWRTLTYKIKERVSVPDQRSIYQIGETYGSPELISSYIGSGMLDGQFDFNVYDAAIATFGKDEGTFSHLDDVLQESFLYYGHHNLMGYITGNQDRARFISYAGGALGWEENGKLAGWTRDIEVGNPAGYSKLSMLTAFNMTIPGVPVIYYGDEIGMPGGNDPDNRRMMRFNGLTENEKETFEKARTLADLRENNLALMLGDFHTLYIDKDIYVYARKYFDQVAVVAFNKGSEAITIVVPLPSWLGDTDLTGHFGSDFTLRKQELNITLGAYGFDVLTGDSD